MRRYSSAGLVTSILCASIVSGVLGCGSQDDGGAAVDVQQSSDPITGADITPSKDTYVQAGTGAGTTSGRRST